ncbi:hypothetical protein [Streptomyces fulvorobeus]|uniref:Ig-like domain-containing protein n=1 Tax=Streptomyces fulvorobeus TaxID=284028 RepID=A0A7J0CH54_9ACTN|nr:hypothetical protein [Streptomyces fulvorobeus]NYE44568.1 hypothetical protein [Streptomyces fulvorobeus]GFN01105.1 hypothetical protein Sfulv_59150 [Streptomyces fulvorobeus]
MSVIPSQLRRAVTATSATLGLGLSGVIAIPTAAQAAPVGIVCAVGSQTTNYSPPLTNAPRQTTAASTENYGCTSLFTGVSSATGTHTATSEQSCLLTVVPPTNTSTRTYTWNTGQSSTITFVSSTVVTAADGTTTITSLGSVTTGLGQGSAAVRVVVQPQLSLTACATTGLNTVNGIATLNILP